MRRLVLAVLATWTPTLSPAQQPAIEVRKLRAISDADGAGFARAPMAMTALSGGRYALSEINETPIVINAEGRLVKRFPRGGGPGEFQGYRSRFYARGDTLWAADQSAVNLFDRGLKLIRKVTIPGINFTEFFPNGSGFVVASSKATSPTTYVGVHVVDGNGSVVRSFVADTVAGPRTWPQPGYRLSPAGDDAFWAISNQRHRLEKWTVAGKRLAVVDTQPAWFRIPPGFADGRSFVISASEDDGILWVMSSVPVPDYQERMKKVVGMGNEVDVRKIPTETLSTAWLEAYDATTGKQLAELPLRTYGVTVLSGNQYVIYSESADGAPQLEIWEMRLKR